MDSEISALQFDMANQDVCCHFENLLMKYWLLRQMKKRNLDDNVQLRSKKAEITTIRSKEAKLRAELQSQ